MMRCPFCNNAAHVRTSRYLSDTVKQSYHQCVNVFCSASFRTLESLDKVISPPAEQEKAVPVQVAPAAPARIADRARSSVSH
ncbi:ogr/Delta-like zinc finger family protein [Leclercia pneumoniae]|uniref:ogr/Delta-like zinc finger family protein n=1 Tax=Leclercia pneumoniae TaxID=2815358 RepID=UPI002DB593B2|nr:ogr/Delta-like zinc finger family protein [Leclercia pneumoniae]MEB7501757.1 ogr/Delta-like zinc finger family protein [Leclercia pneumoniae]